MKKTGRHRHFPLRTAPPGSLTLATLGFVALIVVGPLRAWTTAFPILTFAATLLLFAIPGMLLASLFSGKRLTAQAALGFVLSVGIFGLPGTLALLLHRSLEEYLWACGAVVVASVVVFAALAVALPGRERGERATAARLPGQLLLWVPFAGLTGILAFAAARRTYTLGQDTWFYLAYARDFLEQTPLGFYQPYAQVQATGFSRLAVNGWLLEQAALARVSGVDLVELALGYLAPVLVVAALLAFYGLASMLFEERAAALLAGCLYALFFLITLDASATTPGGEFVGRITEDKFVVRSLFLPVALGLAVLFLRGRGLRFLLLFFFVCLSSAAIHPMGPILVGIGIAGLCLLHVATRPREAVVWTRVGGLVGALLGVVLPPVAYLLATTGGLVPGEPVDSARDASLLEAAQEQQRLLLLGDGSYIMHPSLLLASPLVVVGYLLGVPLLVRRVKEPAAQLLLGILFFVPILVYVPPLATAVGDLVGPWHLWRLTWPLPPAALLALGWAASRLLGYAGHRLSRFGALSPLLPLVLVVLVVGAAAPRIVAGVRSADGSGETALDETDCRDPAFRSIGETLQDPGTVLAPNEENYCLPAYVARASVVSYRAEGGPDAPEGAVDVRRFFGADVVDQETLNVPARYGVSHVLVPARSPLDLQLQHLPGFRVLNTSGERYRLYEVDREALLAGVSSPAVVANGLLKEGRWEEAVALYGSLLESGDEDERILAYVGLGRAYEERNLYAEAAASYEEAVSLSPDEARLRKLLARAYAADQDFGPARDAFEKAVALDPQDSELRLEFGGLLLEMGETGEAVEQYRAAVEAYPEVPEYRFALAETLGEAGDLEASLREIEYAASLNPLLARLQNQAGESAQEIGRLALAAQYYERASELAPDEPSHVLKLGLVHAQLSTRGGRDERYFELAEDELRRVAEAPEGSTENKLRVRALISLGSLYNKWDLEDEARSAYERALTLDPDARNAREGLQKLGQGT